MSSVSKTNNDITPEMFAGAGIGATGGAACARGVMNARFNHLASGTMKAFNSSHEACDKFISKHNHALTKASGAKKGFFGKINAVLDGKNTQSTVDTVVDTYAAKASKKMQGRLSGEEFKKAVDELSAKYMKKDIAKSIKSSQKGLMAAVTLLGAAAGMVAIFTAGEHLSKKVEAGKIELSEEDKAIITGEDKPSPTTPDAAAEETPETKE